MGPGGSGGVLSSLTNTGLIAIPDQEAITLAGTFVNNGSIALSSVGNGATLRCAAGTVLTGSSGTGAIRGAGVNASGGVLSNVTSTGLVAIADGEELSVAGTFTNNGSVTLNSTVSDSVLRFGNGSILTGTGAVTLSNSNLNQLVGIGSGDAVTIAPSATVQGAGRISPGATGGDNMLKITNQGLMNANVSGAALVIRAETSNGTDFTNSGTLRASDGGTLLFTGGGSVTNNGGTLDVATGSTMNSDGANAFSQNAGTISLDGAMVFPQGLDLNGGSLLGNGTFTGPLRNNGGIVGPGHSPGKLTVSGSYSRGANGTKRARADLEQTQKAIYETALPLYKKYFPNADAATLADRKKVTTGVLDKLAEEHPNDDTIVGYAQKVVAEATDFVKAKDIVTVPTSPLDVIVMPEFKRGQGIAYCDSPGPLEKNGKTFFACEPTPKDWPNERKESFYREYNNYMVRDLTVHEAMPGHYLQLAHANQFRGPTLVRAIFQSGTFCRGLGCLHGTGHGGSRLRRRGGKDAAIENASSSDL